MYAYVHKPYVHMYINHMCICINITFTATIYWYRTCRSEHYWTPDVTYTWI